jgi:hypothetical protein
MTLMDMWNLAEYVSNKNFDGNIITPEQFKSLIPVVTIDLFRKKYGIPEGYAPGRPIPKEFLDITLKNTDDMKPFKKHVPNMAVTNGILPYPIDYAHRETVVYNYTKSIAGVANVLPRPVEILREVEFSAREGNYTKRPTTQNPIATIRSDGVHIRPITILAVDFNYLRWPVAPVFNYIEGDGFITYNAATSIESEFPVDEHLTLVKMCLEYIGVSLRDSDIVNYANTKLKEG